MHTDTQNITKGLNYELNIPLQANVSVFGVVSSFTPILKYSPTACTTGSAVMSLHYECTTVSDKAVG